MQKEKADKNQLYPVFLKLHELKLLLVGGGNVALEKLNSVLSNSPETVVTVVAPVIRNEVKELIAVHPHCRILEKRFDKTDLQDKDLIICATDDPELHKEIKVLANAKGLLVNVADTPDLCDFYLGSIVQKGQLKIAISTNGKSPTAAKRIKEVLNSALPEEELDKMIENLHKVRNNLNGNFEYKVKKMNEITEILIKKGTVERQHWKRVATYILIGFGLMLVGYFIFSNIPFRQLVDDGTAWYKTLDPNFHWMVLAGFLAQMVDGATSMGYGVTSSIVLQSAQVSPAAISAGIHTAEMFTSGASGFSHYRFGNVNKKLFKALVIPGVIGAILGAFLLVKLDSEEHLRYLRPIMAIYTLVLGIRIFTNAFRKLDKKKFKRFGWLAGVGGFLDSFGGGGWGPIVTSTLITKGRTPRYVVGSVSLTEFFVTVASALTFFTAIGIGNWQVIAALVIGGVIAAPIAARLAGKLPRKTSFILLGTVVVIWSLRILLKTPWPF